MTWINLNIKKMQNKQFLKIKNSLLDFFFYRIEKQNQKYREVKNKEEIEELILNRLFCL